MCLCIRGVHFVRFFLELDVQAWLVSEGQGASKSKRLTLDPALDPPRLSVTESSLDVCRTQAVELRQVANVGRRVVCLVVLPRLRSSGLACANWCMAWHACAGPTGEVGQV